MFPINEDHPYIYENLSFIIDEFEKAALKSQTREGIMVVANGPLTGMESLVDGSAKALQQVKDTRARNARTSPPDSGVTEDNHEDFFQTTEFGVEVEPATSTDNPDDALPEIPQVPEVTASGGIQFDADLIELMDNDNGDIRKALEECLGCDLRLDFDWQLKPLDLLGPIADMIANINAAMDSLEDMLNPFKAIEGFCDNMNNFSLICIPDWIAILLALKMLLRSYMTFSLDVRLDWSIVLGPMLKLIIEGIVSLINELAGLILAPLDCAISALSTFEDLEKELKDLALTAGAFGDHLSQRKDDIASGNIFGEDPVDFLVKDIGWDEGSTDPEAATAAETVASWDPGSLKSTTRTSDEEKREGSQFSFPTGFDFGSERELTDAIRDPEFVNSSFTTKLKSAVVEAKNWLTELVRKLNLSLRSINSIVSGGLSIQIGSLGLLLFVKDLIALVMIIIQLIQSGQNPKDWCEYFEENPQILDQMFKKRLGMRVDKTGTIR